MSYYPAAALEAFAATPTTLTRTPLATFTIAHSSFRITPWFVLPSIRWTQLFPL